MASNRCKRCGSGMPRAATIGFDHCGKCIAEFEASLKASAKDRKQLSIIEKK